MLLCPVRDCRLPLERGDRSVRCARGHAFDIARTGYINLLQPQERRSRQPGDSAEAAAARRRLHDRGVTSPLFAGIAEIVQASPPDRVMDAGCGEGFYLGSLARDTGCAGHGIDISTPSIDAASRRYRECEWIVGNADRFIPYADGAFTLLLSITGRMNVPEFHRVLGTEGRLLVALAAPDDLVELRGVGRDRVHRTLEEFAPRFQLVRQTRVTTRTELDADTMRDILLSIYRPLHSRPLEPGAVTFSLDLLLFRPL